MTTRQEPGKVRDAIIRYLAHIKGDASMKEIYAAVCEEMGQEVPQSSVRSYLALNTPRVFTRTSHGRYGLVCK
jgi:hypothetical protein